MHQISVAPRKICRQKKTITFKIPTRMSERIRNKKLQYLSPNITSKRIHINQFPNEILLHIFQYLESFELWHTVQNVCSKWGTIVHSAQLWKSIYADDTVPTDLLEQWLKLAPKLQHLKLVNRRDTDFILAKVSRFNKLLLSIETNSCWGTENKEYIKSVPLCNLLKRCSRLTSVRFLDTRFRSCKFYEMIAYVNNLHDRFNASSTLSSVQQTIPNEIRYFGSANPRQIRAFLKAQRNVENIMENFKFNARIHVAGDDDADCAVYNVTPDNVEIILQKIMR